MFGISLKGPRNAGAEMVPKPGTTGPPATCAVHLPPYTRRVDEKSGRRLARSTAIFSLATGLSRILGLVREVVAAYYFGAAGKINAFTVAFQVPNLFRALRCRLGALQLRSSRVHRAARKGDRKRRPGASRRAFLARPAILSGLTALFIVSAPVDHRPVRRSGRRQAACDRLSRGALPDRHAARSLRDRRRNSQQLRALHGSSAQPGLLECRDHRRLVIGVPRADRSTGSSMCTRSRSSSGP